MVYTDEKNEFPKKQIDLFQQSRIICTIVKVHQLQKKKECSEALKIIAGDLKYPLIFVGGTRWTKGLDSLYEKTMNGTIARMLKEVGNPVRELTEKEEEERYGPRE